MPSMPTVRHMINFTEGPEGAELPDPSTVGHAAAWAAERGYWDVATCLMDLAQALARHGRIEAALATVEPAPWMPPGVHRCSHGYLLTASGEYHLGTGGRCADYVSGGWRASDRFTCKCLGYEHAPACPEADDTPDAS